MMRLTQQRSALQVVSPGSCTRRSLPCAPTASGISADFGFSVVQSQDDCGCIIANQGTNILCGGMCFDSKTLDPPAEVYLCIPGALQDAMGGNAEV